MIAARAAFGVYRAIATLATPVVRRLLAARRARGKEHAERWTERLGYPSLVRPAGRLVWVHAVSVGEAVSALPLIAALANRTPVLVTTGTVTSAALMAERLPPGAIHQFAPVDLPASVRRFLDHWRPDAAIWLESEVWPTLIGATAARGIPLALVNARMTERSAARWPRWLAGHLLGAYRLVLAQTQADALRLRRFGVDAETVGNLKHAAPKLPVDEAELARLTGALVGHPRWCLASSHEPEEALAARCHHQLAARHRGLVTVIVPRHPDRGPALAAALEQPELVVGLRSRGDQPRPGLYIADTLGELGLWYRLVDLVLMGGAFAGRGGQNPLEPARLGAAVLLGPDMGNFTEATAAISAGSVQVLDEAALTAALDQLLSDPAERQRLGAAGAAAAVSEQAVLDRVLARLQPLLP
ncbi:MAG: 3-deoxy-D-manno-octulosonic acid transferase [Alphaproteobacteria bacterium]|nr:3-deoxy-D-manno-octulosonic acid transferase [Alphaproteobacteria bacterium]